MEKTYLIEDVAKLLNIPSDTIRLYQNEDLVTPLWDQAKRCYYYGSEQVLRIIGINLYEQLGIDLQEIRGLLTLHSFPQVSTKYAEFIEKTEKEIEALKVTAEKLRFMKGHIDTLSQGIDSCQIEELPDYYVLYEHESAEYLYHDMMDVFTSSAFSFGNFAFTLTTHEPGKYYSDKTQFIVRKPMLEISPLASSIHELPAKRGSRCLYTVAHAPIPSSLDWNLDVLVRYAREHDLVCAPQALAFYVYSLQQNADIVGYYEIFLPFSD